MPGPGHPRPGTRVPGVVPGTPSTRNWLRASHEPPNHSHFMMSVKRDACIMAMECRKSSAAPCTGSFMELPEMGEFQRDFALMSGMKLAFLDELGLGDDLNPAASPLCQALQATAEGRAMCARSRHALLAGVGEKPCCMTCDAGLSESVVPLNIGGVRAGYLCLRRHPCRARRATRHPQGRALAAQERDSIRGSAPGGMFAAARARCRSRPWKPASGLSCSSRARSP